MKRLIISLLAASVVSAGVFAATVDEIVAKANHAAYYQGDDGKAQISMTISDAQGRTRNREFTILRKDVGDTDGQQMFYVYFRRPADVAKTVFMVLKNDMADDDRWLYLPALDLVKRIAASDERTSFVGSHFFYEDVSGRSPSEDTHILVEETDDYYVIDSTPKKTAGVEFSHYKSWIHKATFIPVRSEYYDEKGEVYRTYDALGVEVIDDFATVTHARMSDTRIGGFTEMQYSKVAYNQGISENIFTERYLRNPPRKELR